MVMGRPRKEFTLAQLEVVCRNLIKPTAKEVGDFFQCSQDTIENRVKEWTGLTFSDFRDQCFAPMKYNLIRTAIKQAESGSEKIMIHLLKTICGLKDINHVIHEGGDNPIKTETEVEIKVSNPEREVFDPERVKRALLSER